MIRSFAWAVVWDDPGREDSEADRYVRREYGGPGAQWLLQAADRSFPGPDIDREAQARKSLFRRISRTIVSFF